jgi:hypothetical protein
VSEAETTVSVTKKTVGATPPPGCNYKRIYDDYKRFCRDFSGTGCYGVIGSDLSTALDQFKQLSLLMHFLQNIKRFLINSNLIARTTM